MKKVIVIVLIILLFLFVLPRFVTPHAVDCVSGRCAACDFCGYCQNGPIPGNWEACRNCLYPALTMYPAQANKTLEILPIINGAPTPRLGHTYTMVGCISTNLSDFSEPGAAASLTKVLLNLVFSTVGGVAFLYLIYGTFLILTSQADPERLNNGKRVVYGAIIGLVFSLASIFIINIIVTMVLKIPGFEAVKSTSP